MHKLLLATLLPAIAGCGTSMAVSADGLSLRRVVVYRNGVGYFERAGRVSKDQVRFHVRGNEIGDFLATFAVIERGGSSVKSASFPLKVENGDGKTHDPRKIETVVMALDGGEHDLQVGYIAATPVWRPSYRLVIDKSEADLQAWGIVQNLSGEDWRGVSLSLIAGAPLAFEASLGTPTIPVRPTVTDSGEVFAAVPRGETTLSQETPPPPPPEPPMSAAAPPMEEQSESDGEEGRSGGRSAEGKMKKKSAPRRERYAMPKPPPTLQNPSRPRNLSALAAVAVESGATRYDVPTPITVPDGTATMVLLLSKRVPGEAIYLFAPDAGVPDSASHPFRVARFTNSSGGLLERGPIAIFEAGSFLGQGMVDPLPNAAVATVPFALERSLAVESERSYSEEGARLARIEASTLSLERDAVTKTKYRIKNGGDQSAPIEMRHARLANTRLVNPPKGTKENTGSGNALVPAVVGSHATVELTVDERQGITRNADWLSALADEAIRAYLADKRARPEIATPLKAAWDIRAVLVKAVEERKRLADEQSELQNATEETRNNLKALEKNKAAADLRTKLTTRLAKDALRLDEITKKLVELDMRVNEQRVRFSDLIRGLKLLDPLPPESA